MVLAPRLLTAAEAAAYFHLPVTQFERLRIGRACFGTKVLYDKQALDAHLDALSGLTALAPHNDNDAESALDRFTTNRASPPRRS